MQTKRAGLVLALLLGMGCTRQTGYCDRNEDCGEGQACAVKARRCAVAVELTLSKTRSGGGAGDVSGAEGMVISDPPGITCEASCTTGAARFALGSGVTLSVRPGPGWRFGGWSGPCEGVTPTCAVALDRATEVRAHFVRKVCALDGWCWENPLPQGDPLVDITARPGGVWAISASGTILHREGSVWISEPSEPHDKLLRIDGTGPENLWAVGKRGAAMRRTGGRWVNTTTGRREDLHALSVKAENVSLSHATRQTGRGVSERRAQEGRTAYS